jgi:cytochrome c oxidase subunit 3
MADLVAPDAHAEFQYASPAHQHGTAIAGMWLFLSTEVLFFGVIFATWLLCRFAHPEGFAQAAHATNLAIGSVNALLLITSSLIFTIGIAEAQRGDERRLQRACIITFLLGLAFIILKGVEWGEDFSKHLWPGREFALPDQGAKLFYVIYFVSTALHALHMLVGLGLVSWVAWRSRYGRTRPVTVEIVGLYWSFVDIVWVLLYPLIYLWGRG